MISPLLVPPAPPLSRREAVGQIALVSALLALWAAALRLSGLGARIEAAVGALWLVVAVALQGVPVLLVVAALLARRREPWSSVGLGRAPLGRTLAQGLLAAATCYLAQPLVVSVYLLATGQPPEALAAQKADWLGEFAALPGAAIFPVAAFVGLYEEVLFRGFLQSRLLVLSAAPAVPFAPAAPAAPAVPSAPAAPAAPAPAQRPLPGEARPWDPRAAAVVVLSALLFAVGHVYQGLLGVLQTLTVGLILGALTYRSGSVWPAIVAHVGIDTVGLTMAKYVAPRLQDML